MAYHDDFKSDQFKSAVAIGRYADGLFREECRKRGLNPETATLATIAAEVAVPMRVTMLDDDILNLWQQGLSRPEIMALGCTYNEFQAAIKRARSTGDPRAYYRHGRSRLPWRMDTTKPAKARAKLHRRVSSDTERPADKLPVPNLTKEITMKKDEPPFPVWPNSTGDVGPTFVGPFVDDLVETFAQIDVAKQELDKRFYPRSDVIRNNKD